MKKFSLILLFFGLVNSYSQEAPNTQPLELQTFYIEGKDPINVQSGGKEFPDNRLTLSKMELDSLNSLEKQRSLLLPTKAFPFSIETNKLNKGYLNTEFGRYITPKADFGYAFNIGEAKLLINAGGEYSQGHIEKADYSAFHFKLTNDYIAPSKYWVFGGSRTFTNLSFSNNNFNLYADTNAASRSLFNLNFNVGSEGTANGYNFSTGAGLNAGMLNQTNHDLNNFNLNGFAKVWTKYQNFVVGGNLLANIGTFKTGIHFTQLNGIFNFKLDSNISFNNDLGLQFAGNTIGEEQFGIILKSAMTYSINKDFTLKAILSNGLENSNLENILKYNPYINDSLNLIFGNDFKFKSILYFHPDEKLSFGIGAHFGFNSNAAYFIYNNDGTFLMNYAESIRYGVSLEGSWTPTIDDALFLNLIFDNKTLTSNSNIIPNYSPLNIEINYSRKIVDNFSGKFGIKYVGEKFGDIENKVSIDGFVNLNLGFDYKINDKFGAFIKIDNLLNSDVYYLDKYRQQGLFVALGINMVF